MKSAMIRLLVVRTLVKSQGSYVGHSPTGIGQERRAASVSKETHIADDGQLANHIGPFIHKSPRSTRDGPCFSILIRHQ